MMNVRNTSRVLLLSIGILALGIVLTGCGGSGEGVVTFSISGTVSGTAAQGVTMTLSGAGSGSALTDLNGNYAFASLANGNFTVTPDLSGYTFTPASRLITVNNANVTGIDFTAAATVQSVESVACAAVTADATVSAVGASGFNPAATTISVNQVVRWNNTTGFSHTVTSDTGVWTGAPLNNNTSVCLRFNVSGTYGYHCTPHPVMTGGVTVQ